MKSTFKDERQMEFSLFHGIFFELTLASKENPLVFPIAVSREARKSILTFLTGSFSLDDAYLGSMF